MYLLFRLSPSYLLLYFSLKKKCNDLTLFLQSKSSKLPICSSFHLIMKNKTFTVHYKRFEIIQLKILWQTRELWFSASEPCVNFYNSKLAYLILGSNFIICHLHISHNLCILFLRQNLHKHCFVSLGMTP